MTADEFLAQADIYKLGELTTERPNRASERLSEYTQHDLQKAIQVAKDIDLQALNLLIPHWPRIDELGQAMKKVMQDGGRVFFCGCGATGRLSLTIESLWRELNPDSDQVHAFMAGGDIALVHSLEGFEDFPEFGERHAKQLGFEANDLLVAITEGGETPYVIGAVEYAAKICSHSPYFLYCNPNEDLLPVDRSRAVIENSKINKICLDVGSMTIAGSTRMQASTVLQLAAGKALFGLTGENCLKEFRDHFVNTDCSHLEDFISAEARIYQNGNFVLYVPHDYAITTFTDTTERSPTFSLPPFENPQNAKQKVPSLCYIMIPEADNAQEAWHDLMKRIPHPLDWQEVDTRTGSEYLNDFDFGSHIEGLRQKRLGPAQQYHFVIEKKDDQIEWRLNDLTWDFNVGGLHPLYQHTLLKMLLNTHSTLLMGKLDRYHSNIMTWVSPTNGKLIDRSARNVSYLLAQEGLEVEYDEIVKTLFEVMNTSDVDQPVVVLTFETLKNRRNQ